MYPSLIYHTPSARDHQCLNAQRGEKLKKQTKGDFFFYKLRLQKVAAVGSEGREPPRKAINPPKLSGSDSLENCKIL